MATAADHHTALIYIMVVVSAADSDMTDRELMTIGEIVRTLPVFRDFDGKKLAKTAEACARLLAENNGLEKLLAFTKKAVPARLRETAYALACDVAVADLDPHQEVLRLLELLRHRLGLDRLTAAAIERGARARYATL
ncbi:MAG TPA: tellurite resistance TerB family protein [Candidatus Cybelea sp.]|nr:tellurite resistance TerB family protein [Candidatus Cybelea sp.]